MKTKKLIFLLSVITSLFFACNSSSNSESNAEESPAEESTEEPGSEEAPQDPAPSIMLAVTHEVADFAKWKEVFDAHQEAREAARIEDWALLQGKDNPNLITVVGKVGDLESAEEFMASEDLKARMQEAGVTGEPQITFVDINFLDDAAAQSSTVRMLVRHKVQDFAAWKQVFDEHAADRQAAGITVVGVFTKHDDPNDVTVINTASDFETAEKFANSPNLKEAMAKAGVIEEPTISYFTRVTQAM